jgi:hypothetical protein
MGNPFLFADRFSGAVVHLTTITADQLPSFGVRAHPCKPGSDPEKRQETTAAAGRLLSNAWPRKQKMPAAVWLTQAFRD